MHGCKTICISMSGRKTHDELGTEDGDKIMVGGNTTLNPHEEDDDISYHVQSLVQALMGEGTLVQFYSGD